MLFSLSYVGCQRVNDLIDEVNSDVRNVFEL